MPETSRWLSSLIGGHVAKDPEEVELALLGQRRAQPLAEAELPGPTWLASGSSDAVRVVSRTCCSTSFRNCSIRAAAATAFARSTRTIARWVSW